MSSIDIQLRKTKNETIDDIQVLERSIQRCQENISRLKANKHQFNPEVLLKRNHSEMEQFQEQLRQAQIKLEQIENGLYEDKLREEFEQTRQAIEQKSKVTKKKRSEASTLMNRNAPPKRQPYNRSNPEFRDFSRDFDYAERQFFKDCSTLPDYLHEKLKNMPNNLGYVWKNIWFFGEKYASNKNEYILYEKQNQQFLMHVYNLQTRMYTLYDKDNSGRKKCLNKRPF